VRTPFVALRNAVPNAIPQGFGAPEDAIVELQRKADAAQSSYQTFERARAPMS